MFPRTLAPTAVPPVAGPRVRIPLVKFTMPDANVQVGESVRAQWKGFQYAGKMFPASIAAVHQDGTFNVVFDDGDEDDRCPVKHMVRANGAPLPRGIGQY